MSTPRANPLIAVLATILTFLKLYPPRKVPVGKSTLCPCPCRRCGRPLKSAASRAAGIGPVCAKLEKMCPERCPRARAKKDKKAADASQLELDFKPAVPGPTGKALRVIMGLEKP
ncbi:MAG: hypothetical protein ACD_55C00119G0001 [uncultured bacterium]|uniref:Uncharacterized protein n=1 Tax=Citrifermentans bemidjiense (strain ATCC BAA-1014 / DSM 16622 / JCM 12645 / Bem) TaxID=404380 RepID=B5EC11_CITBB|nr:DUF6011 domain-containing protein [Citrifermentans bemidjiense]ACH40467.1 hypothetical protein Gbem_3474 [Citrifermentans bemidjiense Bem]EKD59185.1 MAG: hypothetical protein ACD_55C00119G0001 [uncultured bacterium]